MSLQRKTIRFEDLGEPVQRLLKSLKGGVTEEDMALLEYVGVKDMKTIYEKMASDTEAHEIWLELREALNARREKAERKQRELDRRQEDIDSQVAAQHHAEEQERLAAEREEEERRKRKEERSRARAEVKAEEERHRLAEQEAAEEAERQAQEVAEVKRREAKRKKREARNRELAEEQEVLLKEQENAAKKKKNQKKEWDEYIATHPLDFAPQIREIAQVNDPQLEHKAPPMADEDLLNRSYTPKCPNCFAKFSRPPTEWDCTICFRRLKQRIKVWQPDEDTDHCMCCKSSVGRFSRHHCRSCGRVVCTKCSEGKAIIPSIGYKDTPVKVCQECVRQLGKPIRPYEHQ